MDEQTPDKKSNPKVPAIHCRRHKNSSAKKSKIVLIENSTGDLHKDWPKIIITSVFIMIFYNVTLFYFYNVCEEIQNYKH